MEAKLFSSLRLVMMGTGPFAAPLFRALYATPHQVVGLVTQPLRAARPGAEPMAAPMREIAAEHATPIFDPVSINTDEAREELRRLTPDLFIVADYGQILSAETLSVARLGGVNLHGSLLPKYRGAAPINWAIYNGDVETGVTVIHMTPRVDAGPTIMQARTKIDPEETAVELERRLAEMGAPLVAKAIDDLAADRATPLPQDRSQATPARRLRKTDGAVDWSRPAQAIKNQIRALEPWPRTHTFWHRPDGSSLRLILSRCEVCDIPKHTESPGTVISADQQLIVATGGGALQLNELQPAGKRALPAAEFLRGYPIKPGNRFGPEPDRRGTTRANVLVAILAIGFLVALILPLVQGAREAARRNSCFCHGGSIATAVINFAARNDRYPGYLNTLTFDKPVELPDGKFADETGVSWLVPILPYMERTDHYQHWSNGDVLTKPGTTYAVNTGRPDVRAVAAQGDSPGWPADWPANGVFFNGYVDGRANPAGAPLAKMTWQYLTDHDGSSLTLMLTERLDGGSYAILPIPAPDVEAVLGVI